MEGTLRHLGEHFGHGIGPIFALHLRVSHDIQAVGGELVAEEVVGEVDLSEDVDEVEDLAEEEADGVEAVSPTVEAPVPEDVTDLSQLLFFGDERLLKRLFNISKTFLT